MRSLFWIFVSVILTQSVAACAAPTETAVPDSELGRRIAERMDADPCSSENPNACRFIEVQFRAARKPEADEDVILILDEKMRAASLGLHAKRVLAHFKAADAPVFFERFQPSIALPTTMQTILHRDLDAQPELASSHDYAELGRRFSRKYDKLIEGGSQMGHGTTSFNILAELNPEAKFVVVHLDEGFHRPPVCGLSTREGRHRLRAYWDQRAEALADLVREYRVRWINYSMGYDVKSVLEQWRARGCRGPAPRREAVREYVEMTNSLARRIDTLGDVLFVQAAPYPSHSLERWGQGDYGADCESLPNRLRVGYFHLDSAVLPSRDEWNLGLLPPVMANAAACTDLYVRDGLSGDFLVSEFPIRYTATGFGHGPMNVPGTSYIAPVGLSHGAYLMKTFGFTPTEVVRAIRGDRDAPRLVAPFAEKRFLNPNPHYLNY